MKLLVTFSVFLCSLFVREPVFIHAGANRCITTCMAGKPITREKAIAAVQTNFGFDENSLFDDDDDDDHEFSAARKKFQFFHYLNNSADLLQLQDFHGTVINRGFANNTWFPSGATICIFQRVIRV